MIKPLPRLLLIAAVVGGSIYGINTYVTSHGGMRAAFGKTATPSSIDVPDRFKLAANRQRRPGFDDYTGHR